MTDIKRFMILVGYAWDGITFLFPVPIALLAFVVGAFVYLHAKCRHAFSVRELALLIPFVTAPVLLAWGTMFADTPNQWPVHMLPAILILHLSITAVLIWRGRGHRLLAVSTGLLATWCAFWSWFIAGMSVTGNWV
jgi:hypothetical protein